MNLKEQLIQLKEQLETKYAILCTDGKINIENASLVETSKKWAREPFDHINYEMKDCYERSMHNNLDIQNIDMTMILGVIFSVDDLVDENTLKENAKPVSSKIVYYTKDFNTYDSNGNLNDDYLNDVRVRHFSFMDFYDFVNQANNEGLVYNGPTSFDELVESVKTRENVPVSLSINLSNESVNDNTRKKLFRK